MRLVYSLEGDGTCASPSCRKSLPPGHRVPAGTHFPTALGASQTDGDSYARDAQILPADLTEDASITTLQTILMLVCNIVTL